MEYKAGDKVVFTDADAHKIIPCYFPEPGTVGKILGKNPCNGELLVEWKKGSTILDDMWICDTSQIIPYKPLKAKVHRRDRAGNRIRVREV